MSFQITLTVTQGSLAGKEFVFEDRGTLMIGRAPDCDLQIPMTWENSDVSRHHCLFEIDPPHVRIRDLGSRNGTKVNGHRIGGRPKGGQPDDETHSDASAAYNLRDRDEVAFGFTIIRVSIRVVEEVPAAALWAPLGLM